MNRSRGIALVSVLWVIALLTIVAGGLSASVRSELRIVSNTAALLQAQFATESGVELAAMNLMYPQALRWPADGSIQEVDIGTAKLRIAVRDETGKVDLNHAPALLLASLLTNAGFETGQADLLVDAILDWRDGDDFPRLNGAEASDYRIADLNYGPRNAPFETVDELRFVLGMTETLYAAVEPALTVYSGRSGVNANAASPQVSQAIAGLQEIESVASGTTYTVQVEARVDSTIISQAEATIDITFSGLGRPYSVLHWEQPGERLFPDPVEDPFQELSE
jgi:general secretion pathway protein K